MHCHVKYYFLILPNSELVGSSVETITCHHSIMLTSRPASPGSSRWYEWGSRTPWLQTSYITRGQSFVVVVTIYSNATEITASVIRTHHFISGSAWHRTSALICKYTGIYIYTCGYDWETEFVYRLMCVTHPNHRNF